MKIPGVSRNFSSRNWDKVPYPPGMKATRREILYAGGIGLLSFTLGGAKVELSPRDAREAGVKPRVLLSNEEETLAALGDRIVPGSRESGVSVYVDHQLAVSFEECMLMIQYLGVAPPFTSFYRSGLSSVNSVARARHGQPFAELTDANAEALIEDMASEKLEDWEGPPQGLFYFVIRNDACDVQYGTQEGFVRLNVPYAAHILPPSEWG
ncbi:MAG: gluconate 2-dehydrogenase subunit 3 family protein [Myxococcota bacterium]|nr:gluconate 2-dehydrogenase subunit 3 family protein [Myxococcota bacterium]